MFIDEWIRKWGRQVFVASLVLAHLVIPVGAAIVLSVGRVRFVGLFFYATAALLVFDVLLFWHYWTDAESIEQHDGRNLLADWRIVGILIALTAAGFAVLGRGVPAYVLASITGAVLLYRATRTDRVVTSLVLLFVFAATLLSARVFTVYYLATTFDTIQHTEIIAKIAQTGNAEQFVNTRYNGFLAFHFLGAILSKLMGVGARETAGYLFVVIFPAAALGTFAFVRRWGATKQIALVASIVLAMTPAFLVWGTKAHYQSLSFAFFPFAALALSAFSDDRRLVFAGIPIIAAWVSTHHFSVVMGITMLSLPIAYMLLRSYRHGQRPNELIPLFIGAVAVKWTVLTSWFRAPIRWITKNSPQAEIRDAAENAPTETPETPSATTETSETPSTTTEIAGNQPDGAPLGGVKFQRIFIRVLEDPNTALSAAIPFFLDYLFMAFLLALSAIGAVLNFRDKLVRYAPLLLGGAIAVVFYFPNPLWLPLRGLAELNRWDIFAAPFVAVLVAGGIVTLLDRGRTTSYVRTTAMILGLVIVIFSMISAGFYAPTTSDLIGADRHDRQYLTRADTAAGDWTLEHGPRSQPIAATSKMTNYLRTGTDPVVRSGGYDIQRVETTGYQGTVRFKPGLTVFQREAFQESAVKVQFEPTESYYPPGTVVIASITDELVTYDTDSSKVVYTNGETVVHWEDES